jgi:alpha/beta superfamily hydrolase
MKIKHIKNSIVILALLTIASSCNLSNNSAQTSSNESPWESDSAWYLSNTPKSNDKIDLFYIVSTNVLSAEDENGNVAYQSQLIESDKKAFDAEFRYVEKHFSQSDFNYFAPYYHQFTFESINLASGKYQKVYSSVSEDICNAFDYYMEHLNNGRRYALVGFSQGGMLVLDLLKHMTDEQYNRMVAAYAIGYRITEEDCKNKHICPAKGETETGVTISFNSALSTDGLWPLVAEDAVTCINPVNWKTDSTPATFTYENEEHTVSIDKQTNILIVKTNRPEYYRKWNNNPAFQSAKVHPDCLHHWDLLFYSDFIHDNILKRAGIEEGK